MNNSAFIDQSDGCVEVHGPLTFDTVAGLCERSGDLLRSDAAVLSVNMKHVSRADSAGLALMVEWLRLAESANRRLEFVAVPEQVRRLVHVSGLSEAFTMK